MVLAHDFTERTQDVKISEDVTFESMLLSEYTLNGLMTMGFYKPSPIQLYAIPLGKCGFDLLLEAKSGTGKTAVFTIIALEKIELNKGLQVIVLAPTREIAAQIYDVIKEIGSFYKGLKVEVVMGGLSVEEDILKFKHNVHIVVGSPGRLRHLIQDKYINVSSVRLLVLDEADKLIEKSFLHDINYIYSSLSKQKQVIMSSATYPDDSKSIINQYMQNFQYVCPDTTCILLGIKQFVTQVKSHSNIIRQTQYRFDELLKILTTKQFKQCLVFCNYQVRVTEVHQFLKKNKWPAEQLYGQQHQIDRLDALKTLQQYKCRLLISTDLSARGIDASNVDLVINFEPPSDWQTYLHRIGRAGRFGSYGMAITILSEGPEEEKFAEMLSSMKSLNNLANLWSSEQYFVDKNENCDIIKSYKDVKETELQQQHNKFLLSDSLVDTKVSKSNAASECLISSFSELLISFNNDNTTDNLNNICTNEANDSVVLETDTKLNVVRNQNSTDVQELSLNADNLKCDLAELLTKSGLPTSFQSKSFTKQKTKKIYIPKKLSLNDNNVVGSVYDCRTQNLTETTAKANECIKPALLNRKQTRNSIKPSTDKRSQRVDHESNMAIDHSNYNARRNHSLNKSSEYKNWYNTLKFNTRQIQMAVYVAELSKV